MIPARQFEVQGGMTLPCRNKVIAPALGEGSRDGDGRETQ
ncbi:MAG: hypothetical protein K0R56_3093 [Sphingomonas sp.]|jgi:hypothetical protein|nr:hypothetical protein [Sphingomonas sp.]